MSELRQQEKASSSALGQIDKLLLVQISPTEVRYMTPKQLEESITEEDIQLGLDSAGIWSDLGVTEEEMLARLNEMRYGSEPSSIISPE